MNIPKLLIVIVAITFQFTLNIQAQNNRNQIFTGPNSNHSFHLENGRLWGCGDNNEGQVGNGSTQQSNSWVQIGTDTTWVTIATNKSLTYGIKSNGTLWAWGCEGCGCISWGCDFLKDVFKDAPKTNEIQTRPRQIGIETNWVSVSVGDFRALAIKSDGSLWGWGEGEFLGNGDYKKNDHYPIHQIGSDKNWAMVSIGKKHSLALKTDGSLWGWGSNEYGQVGSNSGDDQSKPVHIIKGVKFKTVDASGDLGNALDIDGKRWRWGVVDYLDAKMKSVIIKKPKKINEEITWKLITSNGYQTFAQKSDGSVWECDLKDQEPSKIVNFLPPPTNPDNDWINIVKGRYQLLLLSKSGTLWGCGYNNLGQLGIPPNKNEIPTPINLSEQIRIAEKKIKDDNEINTEAKREKLYVDIHKVVQEQKEFNEKNQKDAPITSNQSGNIGNQTSMNENLNVSHIGKGDLLPEVKDSAARSKLTMPTYTAVVPEVVKSSVIKPVSTETVTIFEANGKKGLKDKNGKIVVPAIYLFLNKTQFGLYIAAQEIEKFGLINSVGKVIFPLDCQDFNEFNEDSTARIYKDGYFGMVNMKGEIIIPLKYTDMDKEFRYNQLLVSIGGKNGIINKVGNVLVPIQYDEVTIASENLFIIKKGGKYGIYTTSSMMQEKIIVPIKYDNIYGKPNEIFLVKQGDKWGLIGGIFADMIVPCEKQNIRSSGIGGAPNTFIIREGKPGYSYEVTIKVSKNADGLYKKEIIETK